LEKLYFDNLLYISGFNWTAFLSGMVSGMITAIKFALGYDDMGNQKKLLSYIKKPLLNIMASLLDFNY